MVVVSYGDTGGPFRIPSVCRDGVSGCVYPVSEAWERGYYAFVVQGEGTGCLGKTVHRVVASKVDVGRHPYEGHGQRCLVSNGELGQYGLHNTTVAGSG